MIYDCVINQKYTYYAHKDDKKKSETLEEHTKLCEEYSDILMKDVDKIFRKICNELFDECTKEEEEFFVQCIKDMIVFHDTGKINPLFQKDAMNNDLCIGSFDCLKGSDHSYFSSIIYLDYCRNQLEKHSFKKNRKNWNYIILLNAYVISKHHGSLIKLEDYIKTFNLNGKAMLIIKFFLENKDTVYLGPVFYDLKNIETVTKYKRAATGKYNRRKGIIVNAYIRLLYSLLVSSDYYATSEYKSDFSMKKYLNKSDIKNLSKYYYETDLIHNIRRYEEESYNKKDFRNVKDINILRTEMFLDAENKFKLNRSKNIFYLEAPTGSGKSNCALNLSFKMIENGCKKIWYIYPFNTLVEQNYNSMKKIFDNDEEKMSSIAVLNSVTPMKKDGKENAETESFVKTLLDRQFLNYPIVLTTHVNLFKTLFGNQREEIFGFLQLVDSVIVLDEIQSYRNERWGEIITFLNIFAEILNMKVIIMSATLPNLDILCNEKSNAIYLIKEREKYYSNPLFKNRVEISYELLNRDISKESLFDFICNNLNNNNKVMIEFIKKDTAYEFYKIALDNNEIFDKVLLLTGDDNVLDRDKVISCISKGIGKILLIATQVIEAGVDIDVDLGFKDISKLDSEEQFMGRINRSCLRKGKVYFFNMDNAKKIYTNDIRVDDKFTLIEENNQQILINKNFVDYYKPVLEDLERLNKIYSDDNLNSFFEDSVCGNNFVEISDRMKLIEDDNYKVSVYLSRNITLNDGKQIDGWKCWNDYKHLLIDTNMPYAQKQYKLSVVRSLMNYFIYEIKRNNNLTFNDCDSIGELYAIEDGEKFFKNGKLDREAIYSEGELFISL